ncbi:hypothetical protein SMITH_39 [Smithella sp. ME-1]|uniref:Uncharacterized protein n=1 Tax=hydrocarbon metagenome TaxID=938273 RepID=A0A0W8FLG7_9ZZZZ|nr:hypothetical protein SMITH_39 [Smithella sp. ME-1]
MRALYLDIPYQVRDKRLKSPYQNNMIFLQIGILCEEKLLKNNLYLNAIGVISYVANTLRKKYLRREQFAIMTACYGNYYTKM